MSSCGHLGTGFFFFFSPRKENLSSISNFLRGQHLQDFLFHCLAARLRGCQKKKILLKGKETNLVYPAQSIPPLVIMYQHRILLSSFSPLFMEGGTHLGAAGTTAWWSFVLISTFADKCAWNQGFTHHAQDLAGLILTNWIPRMRLKAKATSYRGGDIYIGAIKKSGT